MNIQKIPVPNYTLESFTQSLKEIDIYETYDFVEYSTGSDEGADSEILKILEHPLYHRRRKTLKSIDALIQNGLCFYEYNDYIHGSMVFKQAWFKLIEHSQNKRLMDEEVFIGMIERRKREVEELLQVKIES